MNKKIMFRNMLADQGMEYTPSQADELFDMATDLLKRSKKLSQLDILKMEKLNVEGMTEQEKQDAISLYNHIKDLC